MCEASRGGSVVESEGDRDEFLRGRWGWRRCEGWMKTEWIERRGRWMDGCREGGKVDNISMLREERLHYAFS